MGINFNDKFDDGFYFSDYNQNDYRKPDLIDLGSEMMNNKEVRRDIFQKIGDLISFAKTTCTIVGAYTIGKYVYDKFEKIKRILNEEPISRPQSNVQDAEFTVIDENKEE